MLNPGDDIKIGTITALIKNAQLAPLQEKSTLISSTMSFFRIHTCIEIAEPEDNSLDYLLVLLINPMIRVLLDLVAGILLLFESLSLLLKSHLVGKEVTFATFTFLATGSIVAIEDLIATVRSIFWINHTMGSYLN